MAVASIVVHAVVDLFSTTIRSAATNWKLKVPPLAISITQRHWLDRLQGL